MIKSSQNESYLSINPFDTDDPVTKSLKATAEIDYKKSKEYQKSALEDVINEDNKKVMDKLESSGAVDNLLDQWNNIKK